MSLSRTFLLNGLEFNGDVESERLQSISTLGGGFAIIGVREAKTGNTPKFVDRDLTGFGVFFYRDQVFFDWVICYPFDCVDLHNEYRHKIYSVILGYLFNQTSIYYQSQFKPTYEIVDIRRFLEDNNIKVNYYISQVNKIIGSLYHPAIKKYVRR